ncbi:MAG: hypothetical protein ACE5KM_13690 [Planctomycetaceae bacterium]
MCCDRTRLRQWLARALWTGAVLAVVALLSGCVWGLLRVTGDAAGAAGAKGVFLVAATAWGLTFVAVVVLSALCQIVDEEQRIED